MSSCPCGSGLEYGACCAPLLSGESRAATAEALMRARYTAFSEGRFQFLTDSLHPTSRHDHDAAATRRWAESSDWLGLEIQSTEAGGEEDSEGVVEFVATFKDKGVTHRHHERSEFRREKGIWYFVEGKLVPPKTEVNQTPKTGRNEPCPCGSGKKYKKCCGG